MKKENSQIRLKKIMNDRGLRQVDILEKSKPFQDKLGIKMSKTHLSNYINGKSNPDQQKLILLSQTLGVSEPWLMGYDVPMIEPRESENDSETIEETITVMKKLEEPRQKVVLDTATNQLDEQNKEKKRLSFFSNKVDFDKISNIVPYDPNKEGYAPVIGEIAAGTPILSEQNFEGMRPVYGKYAGRDDIFWLRVKGESMETEIHDGSFALILQDPDLSEGSIGAIRFIDDNEATLKCVFYECDENGYPLRLRLEPLNPDYPIQYADEHNPAVIEGRLVKVEQDY